MKKPNLSLKALEPLFDKIGKLSRLYRILISIAILGVLSGPVIYFSILPKQQEITKLKDDYQKLEDQLKTLQIKARQLKKYQAMYAEAEERFKVVRKALPEKEDIPSLLASISGSGRDVGLDFVLFQPEGVRVKDFYAEIPVKLNVTGNYHNVAQFFEKVARLPRVVNIEGLQMGQGEGASLLNTSCTAFTYQFIDKPKEEPKEKKKKKK